MAYRRISLRVKNVQSFPICGAAAMHETKLAVGSLGSLRLIDCSPGSRPTAVRWMSQLCCPSFLGVRSLFSLFPLKCRCWPNWLVPSVNGDWHCGAMCAGGQLPPAITLHSSVVPRLRTHPAAPGQRMAPAFAWKLIKECSGVPFPTPTPAAIPITMPWLAAPPAAARTAPCILWFVCRGCLLRCQAAAKTVFRGAARQSKKNKN